MTPDKAHVEELHRLMKESMNFTDVPVWATGENSKRTKAGAEKADASYATNAVDEPLVRHNLPLQAMASLPHLKLYGGQFRCSFMHNVSMRTLTWKPRQQSSRQAAP